MYGVDKKIWFEYILGEIVKFGGLFGLYAKEYT